MGLQLVTLLTVTIVCCDGLFKEDSFRKAPEFADQMCPEDQVEFQTVTKSAVSCVRKCSDNPECRSLVYLPSNKTCFGIKTDYPFGVNTPLPGSIFYRSSNPQTTTTTTTSTQTTTTTTTTTMTTTTPPPTTTIEPGTPMVIGLPDAQFTASSYTYLEWAPWKARINNSNTAWAANFQDTNQWLQVDFSQQILVTHVITKGSPSTIQWTTSYKVLYSTDCTSFIAITDDLGNDQVFAGNVDQHTAVQHAFVPHVVCRCFRINPLSWHNTYIDVRLEVLGHNV